jgi:hypothetical protein
MIQKSDCFKNAIRDLADWCEQCEERAGGPADIFIPDNMSVSDFIKEVIDNHINSSDEVIPVE